MWIFYIFIQGPFEDDVIGWTRDPNYFDFFSLFSSKLNLVHTIVRNFQYDAPIPNGILKFEGGGKPPPPPPPPRIGLTDNEKICASNTRRDYVLIKRNVNNLMLILKNDNS